MAVPTYDELLNRYGVGDSTLENAVSDSHLRELSSELDKWERLARYLEIPNKDIESVKRQREVEEQGERMLESWKQRCGSKATYSVLVRALLQVSRTDLAEKVVQSLRMSLLSPVLTAQNTQQSSQQQLDITPTLVALEEDFFELVKYIETTLEHNKVEITTLTSRFRMLPQSVRRQYETDTNYLTTRQKILDSRTTKDLFDNLTALRHWSFMMPDTLAHIVKDVNINGIQRKVDQYKRSLLTFKAKTKLRDLVGTSFPVPDYCMELTMKVEGWEEKTIEEVEKIITNIMRRATYSGHDIHRSLKAVITGCIELTFILVEPGHLISEKLPNLCRYTGVINIQVDGDNVYAKESTKADVSNNLY